MSDSKYLNQNRLKSYDETATELMDFAGYDFYDNATRTESHEATLQSYEQLAAIEPI